MSNRPGYGSERIDQEPTESEELDFVQPHKKIPVILDLTQCDLNQLPPINPQKSCDNAVSRQTVKEQMIKYGFHAPDMTVTEFVEDLPSVNPQQETGHWIDDKCSVCGKGIEDLIDSREWYENEKPNYCPFCGKKFKKGEK